MPTFDLPALIIGLYGLVLGSFLNVVVYRLPAGIPTSYPSSRCPRCLVAIRPWHNVPVLGWVLLRGRCRDCGCAISARYPLVEAMTGILFVLSWKRFDTLVEVLSALLFSCLMVVLALIDLDHRALPDEITLPAIGLGLLVAGSGVGAPVSDRALAAFSGWLVLTVVSRAWERWQGEPGLGEGDGRMLAGIGAFLGSEGLWLTLTVASAMASACWLLAVAIDALARRGIPGVVSPSPRLARAMEIRARRVREKGLPFGTFLAVAALLVLFSEGGFR